MLCCFAVCPGWTCVVWLVVEVCGVCVCVELLEADPDCCVEGSCGFALAEESVLEALPLCAGCCASTTGAIIVAPPRTNTHPVTTLHRRQLIFKSYHLVNSCSGGINGRPLQQSRLVGFTNRSRSCTKNIRVSLEPCTCLADPHASVTLHVTLKKSPLHAWRHALRKNAAPTSRPLYELHSAS
jgi:hypothetical protein